MVTNKFKDLHRKDMPPVNKTFKYPVERKIADKYVSAHLIEKTYSKIKNENGGWSSKYVPRLLSTVYHDLITEELWNILKDFKYPTIDFKQLNHYVVAEVKGVLPELF